MVYPSEHLLFVCFELWIKLIEGFENKIQGKLSELICFGLDLVELLTRFLE